MIRTRKVLDSARGQPCSGRFPTICNDNPETTVWAHLNGHAFGKGMGIKAHDILGLHLCSSCHAYLDVGHGTRPILSNEQLLQCVLEGVTGTWVRLIQAGIVIVPLDPERLSSERPVPPRKPKAERRPVPNNPERKIQSRNNLRKRELQ
jgi:hypothetical protein